MASGPNTLGDYVLPVFNTDNHEMGYSTKHLQRPIHVQIGGESYELLTTGHLQRALNRSGWTLRRWQTEGLLPPTPLFIRSDSPSGRRGLFPRDFVEAAHVIAARKEVGRRLDRCDWEAFRHDIGVAHHLYVQPVLDGVAASGQLETSMNDGRQAIT
jgi:hypothetical protein